MMEVVPRIEFGGTPFKSPEWTDESIHKRANLKWCRRKVTNCCHHSLEIEAA